MFYMEFFYSLVQKNEELSCATSCLYQPVWSKKQNQQITTGVQSKVFYELYKFSTSVWV